MFLNKYILCEFSNFQNLHERKNDKNDEPGSIQIASLNFEPGSTHIESYFGYT